VGDQGRQTLVQEGVRPGILLPQKESPRFHLLSDTPDLGSSFSLSFISLRIKGCLRPEETAMIWYPGLVSRAQTGIYLLCT